ELPHPLGHRVRVHPGRQRNRLDPAPAQLRRFRAEQQAALPLVQIRTQHRIAPSHRLVGLPLTRHSTTVDPPDTKTYSISSRVLTTMRTVSCRFTATSGHVRPRGSA